MVGLMRSISSVSIYVAPGKSCGTIFSGWAFTQPLRLVSYCGEFSIEKRFFLFRMTYLPSYLLLSYYTMSIFFDNIYGCMAPKSYAMAICYPAINLARKAGIGYNRRARIVWCV